MDNLFNGIFFAGYVIPGVVILIIILILYYIFRERFKNNASPIQTAKATVIAKRSEISGMDGDTDTSYFVTFQLSDSGVRMELNVKGSIYGTLLEGDNGLLTYQRTRFKYFELDQRGE